MAVAGLLGLLTGSFATVVAHRVPLRQSIVHGRSRCPSCNHDISWTENLPVVSYVAQRGRCRHCGARISIRYPLTEIASGGLFAAAVVKFGPSAEAVVFAAFFWVLVTLSAIDFEHKLLPNRIVYPAFATGWLALAVLALVRGETSRLLDAAVGALVFGGLLFVVAFIYPAGMGLGDVKLALVLGTFMGYEGGIGVVLVGMFVAFVVGGLSGLGIMLISKKGLKTQVPFGPYLAAGSVLSVLVGERLLNAYLDRFV